MDNCPAVEACHTRSICGYPEVQGGLAVPLKLPSSLAGGASMLLRKGRVISIPRRTARHRDRDPPSSSDYTVLINEAPLWDEDLGVLHPEFPRSGNHGSDGELSTDRPHRIESSPQVAGKGGKPSFCSLGRSQITLSTWITGSRCPSSRLLPSASQASAGNFPASSKHHSILSILSFDPNPWRVHTFGCFRLKPLVVMAKSAEISSTLNSFFWYPRAVVERP
ncbi:hypothetical protein CRG98_026836 [Punica granatum]|uniref:Uncharacterized protein n=1 Tax=Punica granatum TaxID=22663 RepID=A0A2I0J935_PUNGR|nr:hypothetical protein CRG98_026836 [Punica granatum]